MSDKRATIAISVTILLGTVAPLRANEPALQPEQAVAELARYCVNTGASSDKLEIELKKVKLSEYDIQPVTNGPNVNMRLRLSADHKLDLTYVRGQTVSNCLMHFFLADVTGTMELAGQRFGMSGKLEDHKSLDFDSAAKVAPGLLGMFNANKMDADATGSLMVAIVPEEGLN